MAAVSKSLRRARVTPTSPIHDPATILLFLFLLGLIAILCRPRELVPTVELDETVLEGFLLVAAAAGVIPPVIFAPAPHVLFALPGGADTLADPLFTTSFRTVKGAAGAIAAVVVARPRHR